MELQDLNLLHPVNFFAPFFLVPGRALQTWENELVIKLMGARTNFQKGLIHQGPNNLEVQRWRLWQAHSHIAQVAKHVDDAVRR